MVGVALILCTDDWLKIKPKPRIMLPINKFQNVWRTVGSGSKLKQIEEKIVLCDLHTVRPVISGHSKTDKININGMW